jgi:hypothetical protein
MFTTIATATTITPTTTPAKTSNRARGLPVSPDSSDIDLTCPIAIMMNRETFID